MHIRCVLMRDHNGELIAEPLRDLAMRLYVCIFIYPSQSIIDALIACAIGRMMSGQNFRSSDNRC